jgi:hypothetical protein
VLDLPIPAMSGDDGDLGDSIPLSFRVMPEHPRRRERNPEDACDNDAATGNFLEKASVVNLLMFRSRLAARWPTVRGSAFVALAGRNEIGALLRANHECARLIR